MFAHKLDSDGGIAGWCILLASPALRLVPKLAALAEQIEPIADRLTKRVRTCSESELVSAVDELCEDPNYHRLLSVLARFCWALPRQDVSTLAADPVPAFHSALGATAAARLAELPTLLEHSLRLRPELPADLPKAALEAAIDTKSIAGDLSIPHEVAELILNGLRAQASLLAIAIVGQHKEQLEPWRAEKLVDIVLSGFRGELRLLAACQGMAPPLGLPPFDLEAAEQRHAQVRLGLELLRMQADHNHAPIWPAS